MITCNMIRGRNGEWTMQFTDCGLESATHVHMCTVEELSVIVSIYIYSCILPTVEHTYVHIIIQ